MFYRALETMTVNVGDDREPQEVLIQDGRGYDDKNPKYKKVIARFPDLFEVETK